MKRTAEYNWRRLHHHQRYQLLSNQQEKKSWATFFRTHPCVAGTISAFAGITFCFLIILSSVLCFLQLSVPITQETTLRPAVTPLLVGSAVVAFMATMGTVMAFSLFCHARVCSVWQREALGRTFQVMVASFLTLLSCIMLFKNVDRLLVSDTTSMTNTAAVMTIACPLIVLFGLISLKNIFWKTIDGHLWVPCSLLLLTSVIFIACKIDRVTFISGWNWWIVFTPLMLFLFVVAIATVWELGQTCRSFVVKSSMTLMYNTVLSGAIFAGLILGIFVVLLISELLQGTPLLLRPSEMIVSPVKSYEGVKILFCVLLTSQGLLSFGLCQAIGDWLVEISIGYLLADTV
eukprot:GILJ01002764.1.p1 GENE.GILJ01002764.1~~GILJ01002764.1.p1  ORF type:complete len:347 (+),score=28.10 GILJ01002764.1:89-1129(+)